MSAENGFVTNASNLMKQYDEKISTEMSNLKTEFTGKVETVEKEMDQVQEAVKDFVNIGTATDTVAGLVKASDDIAVDGEGKMSIAVDKSIMTDDVTGNKYKMGVSDGGLYYQELESEVSQ